MISATLQREPETDGATLGILTLSSGEVFQTLELPWLDNEQGVSCIPAGEYKCSPHGWDINSTVHEHCVWEVTGVHGRSGVLIHAGNTVLDIKGCILAGMIRGQLNGMPAVLQSVAAIEKLQELIGPTPWTLIIINP